MLPSSYLILEQYSNNPSYRVGLEVSESIITPEDDPSLNDNAAGTSNYSAPADIVSEFVPLSSRKQLTMRQIRILSSHSELITPN